MKIIYILICLIIINFPISSQSQLDTIQVTDGWNLIGSLSSGVTLETINSIPPGIIESSFWGFTFGSGYYQADTLNKGRGYWVKVSQNGFIIFRSTSNCGTVEYDGKIYNTVIIGMQCWLKENLNVGVMVQGNQNQTNNGVIEKYCYANNPSFCDTRGGLYQWDEAMQYSTTPGAQGICPPGWHIPTYGELQTLKAAANNDGRALKAVGQGVGLGAGTNTSGFSAIMYSYRETPGGFYHLGLRTGWWGSTEFGANDAGELWLYADDPNIYSGSLTLKSNGFSIRCVKD